MSGDLPVTVVVPVKDEERNLPRCLAALDRFTAVVVVDSGSTDRTVEIAKAHGAKVLDFAWNGRFPKKRNWVLTNHPPETEWVLFLDADEVVDAAFCDALAARLGPEEHAGYWLTYRNYFLGRELRHGLAQRKLALFRVGAGLYERIDEQGWSKLDMEVHEHPVIEGTTGEFAEKIDHRDYRGLARFLDRHRDYAAWEANRILLLAAQPERKRDLTARQAFKYRHIEKWWYPWFYFLYAYLAKQGFRDGAAGFHYAFYKAWYFASIRLLVQEMREGRVSAAPAAAAVAEPEAG
ncbi:MAG: glycosyltransferase family 2 protein [Pseudomonadota bacterium]